MAKYSCEFKYAVVQDYLSGNDGYQLLSEQHGVDSATIRKWVTAFRIHGIDGLAKKFSHYDAHFKLKVLQYMDQHQASGRHTAAVFNIRSLKCISDWKQQYDSGGLEALMPRPRGRPMKSPKTPPQAAEVPVTSEAQMLEALRKENEYLRMENAYLKKLDALIRAEKPAASQKKRK